MINFVSKNKYDVYDLKELIRLLRSPGGCPWDIEQTHESIRRNFVEEAYEAVEAIDEGSTEHLCEELGDVLMQVVFHAQIEEEQGRFDLDDVADMVCRKMLFRHPHVFGENSLSTADEVLEVWDEIKREEKKQQTVTDTLRSVARSLPSLWRADKLQSKAAKAGFAWENTDRALEKLRSEVTELEDALHHGSDEELLGEIGDLIFAAVTIAQMRGLDPEEAVTLTNEKYIRRFERVEQLAQADGREIRDIAPAELEALYRRAKEETN